MVLYNKYTNSLCEGRYVSKNKKPSIYGGFSVIRILKNRGGRGIQVTTTSTLKYKVVFFLLPGRGFVVKSLDICNILFTFAYIKIWKEKNN